MSKATNPSTGNKDGYFAGLGSLITSAAGAVVIVLGLFNSVFASLVPPLSMYRQATIGWLSLGSVVLLLALGLFFAVVRGKWLSISAAATSLAFLLLALNSYAPYVADLRTHVYQVPPPPAEPQKQFVRGELHAEGIRRLGMSSVDSYASAALNEVLNTEVLWTQKSLREVESRLETKYVFLVMWMLAAIFTSSVALWTTVRLRRRS